MYRILINFVIFLFSFLIGYISTPKIVTVQERSTETVAISPEGPATPIINDEDLEIIDEIGNEYGDKEHFKIKLLETGEGFHGDEISAINGEKWLGLFIDKDLSFLRLSQVDVKRAYDPVIDDDNSNRKTGKSANVRGRTKPVFLLKNAPKLLEGRVKTYFRGITWEEASTDESTTFLNEAMTELTKNFSQSYEADGHETVLKVIKAKTKDGEKILALVVEREGIRQILHTLRTSYEGDYGVAEWLGQTGVLYWVGDLDGDKKPDFYMSLFVDDNVSNMVLFLSGEAEKGKLVKKVAHFVTTGC